MLTKATARVVLGTTLLLSSVTGIAQERATCAFSEGFPEGDLPAGWTISPEQVERLDGDGNGTGEFTAPFRVGTTTQANVGGYFPVPDEPPGNSFAMANDDAPPCDCAMDQVSLTSPLLDLSALPSPAVSYRVYHDGRPFNTHARLEGSTDGNSWTLLEEFPAVLGAWQPFTTDLADFGSGPLYLRFVYDDGGSWASGFALDDLCIFERLENDIALTAAWLGDAAVSPFNTSSRSLGYSRMPIEQQTPLRLSARIRNNGLAIATEVQVETTISVDGGSPFQSTVTLLDDLAPLHDTLVSWEPGFVSDEAGVVTISVIIGASTPDEEVSDNSTALGYTITSSAEGNNTMALDNDLASTEIGTDAGSSAGCRFEMVGSTSTVHGISVRFGPGTQVGSRVHALLMDEGLNLLSSSASHTITEEDLSLSFSGGSVYIPLDSVHLISQPQDVIALVRCLPDSGAMRIACGGGTIPGAAFNIDAGDLLISYPAVVPIVRIHLMEPVTAISEVGTTHDLGLTISPNPAVDVTWVNIPNTMTGQFRLDVFDTQGQSVLRISFPSGTNRIPLNIHGWKSGIYTLCGSTTNGVATARLVVR